MQSPNVRPAGYRPLRPVPRGFSLAEALVVLTIIVIGTVFAVSAYSTHTRTQATRATAQQVSQALIYAKNHAIMQRVNTAFRVDLSRQLYWVDEVDAAGNTTKPQIVERRPPENNVLIQDVILGSTTISAGTVSVRFDSLGNNQLVSLALRREIDDPSDAASYFTVKMFPAAGEARVYPHRRH